MKVDQLRYTEYHVCAGGRPIDPNQKDPLLESHQSSVSTERKQIPSSVTKSHKTIKWNYKLYFGIHSLAWKKSLTNQLWN